jgi:diamine N-acetyltransferase
VKVRKAALTDYEKLKPVHTEVHKLHVQERPNIYQRTDETLDYAYFQELVESHDGCIFVIENGNEIVAFTFLRKRVTPNRAILSKKALCIYGRPWCHKKLPLTRFRNITVSTSRSIR